VFSLRRAPRRAVSFAIDAGRPAAAEASHHGSVRKRGRGLVILAALVGSLVQVAIPAPAMAAATPVGSHEFTLIAIGDTQNMIEGDAAAQARAASETQWIADSELSMRSVWAAQLGDIVNTNTNTAAYGVANTVFATLDNANFPYSVLPGNHDLSIPSTSDDGANFNSTFPPSRFSSRSANWHSDWSTAQYGGYLAPSQPYGSTSDPDRGSRDNWGTFTAGGMNFLVINLEYGLPSAAVAWAGRILDAFPNYRAIITTHAWLDTSGNRMYDSVFTSLIAPHCNVFLVLSGHNHSGDNLTSGEAQRSDMHTNSSCSTTPVYQVMSDYQDRANGSGTNSMGALRYYVFDPDNNQIHALTYYPSTDAYETDASSQFDLAYNMAPSGPPALPGTPTAVTATAGNATAHVTWGAAPASRT
jgi:3',5'-cyclic AMP phosphodiesterase CpdA